MVIAIIGILAAIAVPQVAAYRRRGFESQMRSDLKNVAVAEESYFADLLTYNPCNPCYSAALPGFNPTTGVTVIAVVAGETFTLTGTHAQCGADVWTYSVSPVQ